MKRSIVTYCLFALLAFTLLGARGAAAAGPEVLTVIVDVVTPTGQPFLGTFLVERGLPDGRATWTFNGTLAGRPVAANGSVTERWDANGVGTVTLTAINAPGTTLEQLPLRSVTLKSGNGGLLTLLGLPLSISGPIRAPGAGNDVVYVTMAGRGSQQITRLPNTAGAMPELPVLLAPLALLVGLGLLGLASHRRRLVPTLPNAE